MHFLTNGGKKVLVFQVDQLDAEFCRPNAHFFGGIERERTAVHAQQKLGIAPASHRRPQPIRLPMLAGVPALTCHLETHDGAELPPLFARMRNSGATFAGDWLAEAGLPIPPMRAESVAIFRLRAA